MVKKEPWTSLSLGIIITHISREHLSWKQTATACALFPVTALLIISLSPESPSWLVSKKKYDEAKKAFKWLRKDGDAQRAELEAMIEAQKKEKITSETRENREKKQFLKSFDFIKGIMKIFKEKEFLKPSMLAICMLIVFEFGGAHMVPAYEIYILRALLNEYDSTKFVWQLNVTYLLGSVCPFLAIFFLYVFKRRTILFTSGILTVLCLSFISVCIYLKESTLLSNTWILNTVPMPLMILYTLSLFLGLVPLKWVICGEVFPLPYRSLGATLSSIFLTSVFVLSMKTAPHLYSSIGVQGAFLVYSALLTVCLIVMYTLLPETKDRTLQEIENSFKGQSVNDLESEMTQMGKDEIK